MRSVGQPADAAHPAEADDRPGRWCRRRCSLNMALACGFVPLIAAGSAGSSLTADSTLTSVARSSSRERWRPKAKELVLLADILDAGALRALSAGWPRSSSHRRRLSRSSRLEYRLRSPAEAAQPVVHLGLEGALEAEHRPGVPIPAADTVDDDGVRREARSASRAAEPLPSAITEWHAAAMSLHPFLYRPRTPGTSSTSF